MNYRFIFKIAFIVWGVSVAFLSVMPHQETGVGGFIERNSLTTSGMEKHLFAYFIGTLLCCYSFIQEKRKWFFIVSASFTLFGYGLFWELVQFYLPYRSFNPNDLGANAIGILLFWGIQSAYNRILKDKRRII